MEVLSLTAARITDKAENYERGDLEFPSGRSAEVKSQPINPERYTRNFVEVCERTTKDLHKDGLSLLASTLGMERPALADVTVFEKRKPYKLGNWPTLSVSVHTFAAASAVIYCNPQHWGKQHVYVYDADALLAEIRGVITKSGMNLGMGNSNEDTFGILVSLPRWRWERENGNWTYGGVGDEATAIAEVRSLIE